MKTLSLSTAVACTMMMATPCLAQLFDRPDFFERGNELLEQEIQQLQQRTPEPAISVEGKEQTWQHFVSREGGFSIWAPRGAITQETKILETDAGAIEFKVLATNPQSSRFVVAYTDELTSAQLEKPEAILVRLKDRIVENTDFELAQERSISFDEYPGKQLRFQNSGETITFKVYLIEQRVYVLGASQPDEGEPSQTAIAFFDSFELLE